MGHESTVNEAITLLNAIQHNNHILLDKEEGASIGKELFELPGGSQNVERQKSLVIDFIAAIDDAVAQIDVCVSNTSESNWYVGRVGYCTRYCISKQLRFCGRFGQKRGSRD